MEAKSPTLRRRREILARTRILACSRFLRNRIFMSIPRLLGFSEQKFGAARREKVRPPARAGVRPRGCRGTFRPRGGGITERPSGFSGFSRGESRSKFPAGIAFAKRNFANEISPGGSIFLAYRDCLTSFRGRPILGRAPNRGPLRGHLRRGDRDQHALRIGQNDDLSSRVTMIENKYIMCV